MPSHPLHEARAALFRLIDLALANELQRITRQSKEAVVIVSEADRSAQPKLAPSLANYCAKSIDVEADAPGVVSAKTALHRDAGAWRRLKAMYLLDRNIVSLFDPRRRTDARPAA